MMIEVVYTQFSSMLTEEIWQRRLSRIPLLQQKEINRFRRWQDRQAKLLGKLLLIEAFQRFGFGHDVLNHLSYDAFGRPFLAVGGDFNISHSGGCVICAATDKGRVGIDIEEIRHINMADFKHSMTSAEWASIQNSNRPHSTFFEYWTIKESVLKAHGQGLSIPLNEIHIHKDRAILYNETWFLKEVFLASDYACCLATDQRDAHVTVRKISF